MYSDAMFSTSHRTRFKPLESVVRRQVVWLTAMFTYVAVQKERTEHCLYVNT